MIDHNTIFNMMLQFVSRHEFNQIERQAVYR